MQQYRSELIEKRCWDKVQWEVDTKRLHLKEDEENKSRTEAAGVNHFDVLCIHTHGSTDSPWKNNYILAAT